jgi:hypothetical protein
MTGFLHRVIEQGSLNGNDAGRRWADYDTHRFLTQPDAYPADDRFKQMRPVWCHPHLDPHGTIFLAAPASRGYVSYTSYTQNAVPTELPIKPRENLHDRLGFNFSGFFTWFIRVIVQWDYSLARAKIFIHAITSC